MSRFPSGSRNWTKATLPMSTTSEEFGPEIAHMRHDCAEVIGPPEEAWRTVRRERRVRVQSKAGARFHRDVDDRVVMRRQGHLRTEQPAVPVGRAVDVPHRDEDLADLAAYRSRHRSIVCNASRGSARRAVIQLSTDTSGPHGA